MAATLACSHDAPTCVYPPCAAPEAAVLSVSATNAPAGVGGLNVAVNGAITGGASCVQAAVTVCHVLGGPGDYVVQVSAPGYVTQTLQFTVTGTSAGCNTCGHVDRQDRTVVLQPVS